MIRQRRPSLCSRRHQLSRRPFLRLSVSLSPFLSLSLFLPLSPLLLQQLLLLTPLLPQSPLLLQSPRPPKCLLQTLSRLSKHTEGRQDDACRTPRYATH